MENFHLKRSGPEPLILSEAEREERFLISGIITTIDIINVIVDDDFDDDFDDDVDDDDDDDDDRWKQGGGSEQHQCESIEDSEEDRSLTSPCKHHHQHDNNDYDDFFSQ